MGGPKETSTLALKWAMLHSFHCWASSGLRLRDGWYFCCFVFCFFVLVLVLFSPKEVRFLDSDSRQGKLLGESLNSKAIRRASRGLDLLRCFISRLRASSTLAPRISIGEM